MIKLYKSKEEELKDIFNKTLDESYEWYNKHGGAIVENRKLVRKKFHDIDVVAGVYSLIPGNQVMLTANHPVPSIL